MPAPTPPPALPALTPAVPLSASPARRAWQQQRARVERLRAQLAELDALEEAHRAERQAVLVPLQQRAVVLQKQLVQALAHALSAKWLAGAHRQRALARLCDTAQALAEDGHADMAALHDAHSPRTLAQKRQDRAALLRTQFEHALGAPLDGLDGASPEAVLRAGFDRLQGAQRDRREARQQKRTARREARRPTVATAEARADTDADALLRRLFRQLASALHPDREPDPRARAHKTALMAEANAAHARRDLLALMQLQQRAAAHARTEPPDDELAAFTGVLRRQVADLERERAARQQALARHADLPDGVSANANTLRQARIDELRRLEQAVADATHALAQASEVAALKRWLARPPPG